MSHKLHPQLQADCYQLGFINNNILLLHKNALIPWFILIPDTDVNELHKLDTEQQRIINEDISKIARFVEAYFQPDKLNIATIGNIVPQLHIHIIGRFIGDFCWPKPVWGQEDFCDYKKDELESIRQALVSHNLLSAKLFPQQN